MSFFNALYTFGGCRRSQPKIDEHSKIKITVATSQEKALIWAKWIITFPVRGPVKLIHGIYTLCLMAKCQEIHEPVGKQISERNVINYMPSLIPGRVSFHIISCPRILSQVFSHYRNDPEGVFQGDVIEKALLPLPKDLYPEEKVSKEDFLFTCSREAVKELRKPFEEYIGPKALPQLRAGIEEVSEEILAWLAKKESDGTIRITAEDLTEISTVTILSRLFLNHPGTLDDYHKIGKAATLALNYQLIRDFSTPSLTQKKAYAAALEVLRAAIDSSTGPFVDALKQMSFMRQKSTLLLVYVAGSDTTSSALQYMLWRLGQQNSVQQKILQSLLTGSDQDTLKQFMSECFRLYTPADLISRYARDHAVITVQNKGQKPWTYTIAKGDGIMCSPFLIGRSKQLFKSPDSFQPERLQAGELPNKVFSEGFHGCPGKWFALAEMRIFLNHLISRYQIHSLPLKKELSMRGFMTLKTERVDLTLVKRKDLLLVRGQPSIDQVQ